MSEQKKKKSFNVEEKKNYSCTLHAEVWGEIRKVEDEKIEIEDKEYHRLRLTIEGKDEERFYLTDKEMSHLSFYEKGMKGIFQIRIDVDAGFRGKTKISIVGFKEE